MRDPLLSVVPEIPPDFRLRNLERVRIAREWTRETLAERSGVTARTVKDQERGTSDASLETAWRLAKALGVSIDVLVMPIAGGEVVKGRVRKRRPAAPRGDQGAG